jgi:hypothetical protein
MPITELVSRLALQHVTWGLDRTAPGLRLVFDPPPRAGLIGDVIEATPWLLAIAYGRHTGHALAVCDACGATSMLALRTPSGATLGRPGPQGGKPAPWPACLDSRCTGRRVVDDLDREGVAADRRPPAIGRPPKPERPRGLPWPTDPTYRGG